MISLDSIPFMLTALAPFARRALERFLGLPRGGVCRADDGGGATGHEAAPPPQGKDRHLKSLIDRYPVAVLMFLGLPFDIATGARDISKELFSLSFRIRRPDCVFLLADGSILVIEFQSTADPSDALRFFLYASILALKYSEVSGKPVRVRVMTVYAADVKGPVQCRFPDAHSAEGDGYLVMKPAQVFLPERIDMLRAARNFDALMEARKPGDGKLNLDSPAFGELMLAPHGSIPGKAAETALEYLGTGLKLAKISDDPSILGSMLFGIAARGIILSEDVTESYWKELNEMNPETACSLFDKISNGAYSALQAKLESLATEKESLATELESQATELNMLRADAVLRRRAEGMTPEDISAELKLDLSDVNRILGGNGNA
jgi:hypothetical protein